MCNGKNLPKKGGGAICTHEIYIIFAGVLTQHLKCVHVCGRICKKCAKVADRMKGH